MSEFAKNIGWETPLQHLLAAYQSPAAAAVQAREWPQSGVIILRGHSSDAAFTSAAGKALGCNLPTQAKGSAVSGSILVLRLSPDEWFIRCSYNEKEALKKALENSLEGVFAQVVDNSGGYTGLTLSGSQVIQLLRHITPYNVESLQTGDAVGTILSKSHVILYKTEAGCELIFRRSFADYVWKLLVRSSKPYGLAAV